LNSGHHGLCNDTPLDPQLEKKILRANRARAYLRARAKFLKNKKTAIDIFDTFHLKKNKNPSRNG